MKTLSAQNLNQLKELGIRLMDQHAARIIVPPLGKSYGYWFGGGNLIFDQDGEILISGRFRNEGDARTGTGSGERGLECAIFRGQEPTSSFEKVFSLSKDQLSFDHEVVSIEGVSLLPSLRSSTEYDLYVSTEKNIPYPKQLIHFQKPGTGVWSIDHVSLSRSLSEPNAGSITPVAGTQNPGTLHLKDPLAFRLDSKTTHIIYCSHPFSWSSSNSGLLTQSSPEENFSIVSENILPRGNSWDVACSRITERLPIPKIGAFSELPDLSLYFYDGAECLRPLEQNQKAAKRPRGYSCEELGGLAWGWDSEFPIMEKLSIDFPLFISPYGTGCSRYVSALSLSDGSIFATWQQSQDDLSQPLVGNHLPEPEVNRILAA